MTIEESASYLKTSPETVEKLIRSGELPACRIGKMYVLMLENLYAFLLQKTQLQSSERRNILQRDDDLRAAVQSIEQTSELNEPTPPRRGRPRKPLPLTDDNSFTGLCFNKKK